MKRALTILLATVLLFSLAACRKEAPAQTEPVLALPTLAEAMANLAFGISNGTADTPATHMAVTTYVAGTDFDKLDLAIGPFGQMKVTFQGEKEGDRSEPDRLFGLLDELIREQEHAHASSQDHDYSQIFEVQQQLDHPAYGAITGPYFAFEEPVAVHAHAYVFLFSSGALADGLVPVELQYDTESLAYPPACDADVAKAAAMQPGRKVVDSQLLGTAEDGARICYFGYESLEGESLFSTVYIDEGDAFLSLDTYFDDGYESGRWWHAYPGNAGLLALLRTQEGVLLLGAYAASEVDTIFFSLCEANGALEFYGCPGYFYDPWTDEFNSSEPDEHEEIENIQNEKIEEKPQ